MPLLFLFPVLALVLGVVLYFASSNPKIQRVGEMLLFAGILTLVLVTAFRGGLR